MKNFVTRYFSLRNQLLFARVIRLKKSQVQRTRRKIRDVLLWMNHTARRVRTFTRLHKKKRSSTGGRKEGKHTWKGNGVVDYVSSLRDSKGRFGMLIIWPSRLVCISYLTAAPSRLSTSCYSFVAVSIYAENISKRASTRWCSRYTVIITEIQ